MSWTFIVYSRIGYLGDFNMEFESWSDMLKFVETLKTSVNLTNVSAENTLFTEILYLS